MPAQSKLPEVLCRILDSAHASPATQRQRCVLAHRGQGRDGMASSLIAAIMKSIQIAERDRQMTHDATIARIAAPK